MIGRRSPFAEVLGRICRWDFWLALRWHGVEKCAKGFSSCDQLVLRSEATSQSSILGDPLRAIGLGAGEARPPLA